LLLLFCSSVSLFFLLLFSFFFSYFFENLFFPSLSLSLAPHLFTLNQPPPRPTISHRNQLGNRFNATKTAALNTQPSLPGALAALSGAAGSRLSSKNATKALAMAYLRGSRSVAYSPTNATQVKALAQYTVGRLQFESLLKQGEKFFVVVVEKSSVFSPLSFPLSPLVAILFYPSSSPSHVLVASMLSPLSPQLFSQKAPPSRPHPPCPPSAPVASSPRSSTSRASLTTPRASS